MHPIAQFVLCMMCLSVPASASFELRQAGLRRWSTERSRDYLAEIADRHPQAASVGRAVCIKVLDPEDRWMCGKRGAWLALRMLQWSETSRLLSNLQTTDADKTHQSGVRVIVKNGKIRLWQYIGGHSDSRENKVNAFLGKMLEGIRGGVLPETAAFDVLASFGDVEDCSTLDDASLPVYPVVRYSMSASCAHHIPLPFAEALQSESFTTTRPYKAFANLKPTAIFRGAHYNPTRTYLAVLSVLGAVPLDVGLTPSSVDEARCKAEVEEFFAKGMLPADALVRFGSIDKICDIPSETISVPRPQLSSLKQANLTRTIKVHSDRTVAGTVLNMDSLMEHKYVIVVDGHGAALRFAEHMRGPGVVLHIPHPEHPMQEYFFPDLVPWVHYVPLTADHTRLLHNITETLEFLDKNVDIAESIASESTRWVNRHKSHASDHRQWKLYYKFMQTKWDRRSQYPRFDPINLECAGCTSLGEISRKSTIAEEVFRRTCGGEGLTDELTAESEVPYYRAPSVMRLCHAARNNSNPIKTWTSTLQMAPAPTHTPQSATDTPKIQAKTEATPTPIVMTPTPTEGHKAAPYVSSPMVWVLGGAGAFALFRAGYRKAILVAVVWCCLVGAIV